ncbi:MAG: hypothetical protein RIT28_5071 [Pseudomonadota bacterium]
MRRRDLLRTAAALGGLSLLPGQRSWAKSWGAGPDKTASGLLLPKGVRAEKVLEVFLYGGLGPFESFYVVEEYGRPDDPRFPNEQWHLFASRHEDRLSACGVTDSSLLPFATDALGMKVKLSPWLAPLRARPDMLSRMRILVQRHDLEPHEAAIPVALSGMRLGSARLCGLGAHVQRYHQERDHSARRVPFSYVLYPDTEISTDNLSCASAVGLHPGASRPLDLRITAESELPAQLAREILGDRREAYDALLAHYALAAQTRYSADGVMVRSSGLNDHSFALEALRDANALRALFPDELLARQPNKVCGSQNDIDTTRMGLNMAAHLLTHPVVPARYVNVVDGGLIPATGGGGYDTHTDHLKDQSRNLSSMLKSLVSITNEPGEMDPSKIDLDETLIVLNTEFGRTPFVQQGSGDGTNHHPYGYVTVLIGGPIGEEQAGVVGAIGPTAWADRYVTPIESRAAVLAAMGIYPFTQESFAIGDLREQHVEKDGLAWLNEIVLGRRA